MKILKEIKSCKECHHLIINKSYEESIESAICNNSGGILKYNFDYRVDKLDIPQSCPCINEAFDKTDMLDFIDFYRKVLFDGSFEYYKRYDEEVLENFLNNK